MARRFKKVEGGHGHHGGAWKVAYADFVTAMMALFMVLWLLASTDQKSRKEISNYFRTGLIAEVELPSDGTPSTTAVFVGAMVPVPTPPTPVRPASASHDPPRDAHDGRDEREKAAEDLVGRLDRLATLDPELAAVMRNVHVAVAPDGVVIEAVDQDGGLLFDVSSSRLNEPLERFLRALAPALSALDRTIEINGHTDARPYATGARISNWDLSYQRAAAARDILEASGVASRLIVGVFARGVSQLYLPNEPFAPQNRRLSILVKIAKNGDTKLAASDRPVPN
jgi:chemotaxis protein MotB